VDNERLLEKRQAILDAAEKVFDAHGYAGTTMEAVAEQAGIAKGSIYNYFTGKHELFAQVFARIVGGAHADTGQLLAESLPAADKLGRLLDYWSQRLGYYTRVGRLVLESWAAAAREGQGGELAATFQEIYARSRRLLGSILAQGVRSGEFDPRLDPPVAASLILGILDGIVIQSILDVGVRVDEAFLAALRRAILLGLEADAAAAQTTGSSSSMPRGLRA
jgi:AcrR family transcriptional regulator